MDSYLLGHSGGFQDYVNPQETSYLPTEMIDYIPQPKEQDVRDEGFEQKLRTFISRKWDFLSEANDIDDDEEVHSVGNDDDKYAKMPPLESFMGLSPEICRQHFFTSLERKDVLIGVVKSVIDSGLVMSVLCMDNGKARDIDELKVTAFCPAKELPRMFPHQSPIEGFQVKDKVRGLVLNVNPDTEKIIVTMLDRTMSDDGRKIKLGLINEDDFPVHYRRKLHIRGLTFEELLHSIVGFNNSNNVPCLLDTLHLSDNISLMAGLHGLRIPEKEHAEQLRKYQSQKWAHQNVVNGVSMFKAGKQVEAMQYLNKALQIDEKNVEALVARGALYANNESYHKAIEDFEVALEMNPQHQNARTYLCETVLTLAKIDEDHGNYEGAEKHYRRAQQLQPNSVEIRELLRFMFVRKERKERELRSESSRSSSNPYSDDRRSPKSGRLERTTQTLKKLINEDRKGHRDSRKRRRSPSIHSPDRKRHRDKSSHRLSQEEYDQFKNPDSTAEEAMHLKQELEKRAEERRRLDDSPSKLFGIDHKASFLFGQDGNYRTSPPKNVFSRDQGISEMRERRNKDKTEERKSDFERDSRKSDFERDSRKSDFERDTKKSNFERDTKKSNFERDTRKSQSHAEERDYEDIGGGYSREQEHKQMHRHREGMDWEERESFEMFRKGDNSEGKERLSKQKRGKTLESDFRHEGKVKRRQSSSSSSSDSSSDSDSNSSGSSSSSNSSRSPRSDRREKSYQRDSNRYSEHRGKKVYVDKYKRSETKKGYREADTEKVAKQQSNERERRRESSQKYDKEMDRNYSAGDKDLLKEKKKKKIEQYDEIPEHEIKKEGKFKKNLDRNSSPNELSTKSSRRRSKESVDRKSPMEEKSKPRRPRSKDRRSIEKSERQPKDGQSPYKQTSSKTNKEGQSGESRKYDKDLDRSRHMTDKSQTSNTPRDKELKRDEDRYKNVPKNEGNKLVPKTNESHKDTPTSSSTLKGSPTTDRKSGFSFHIDDGDEMVPKAHTPVIDKLMKSKWDSPSDEKYYKEIKITNSSDKSSSRFDSSPMQRLGQSSSSSISEMRKQSTPDKRNENERKSKETIQQTVKSSKELEMKKKDGEKKTARVSGDSSKKDDKSEGDRYTNRQSKSQGKSDKIEEIRTMAKSDVKTGESKTSLNKSKQSDSDWSEEERKITRQRTVDKKEFRDRKSLETSQETRSLKSSRQRDSHSPRSDSYSPERNTSADKHQLSDTNVHRQNRSNEGLRIHITNDRCLPSNRENPSEKNTPVVKKEPTSPVHSNQESVKVHRRSRSKDSDQDNRGRNSSRKDKNFDNKGKSKKRHSADWYAAHARRQNRDRSRESPKRSDGHDRKHSGSSQRGGKQNLPDVIPSAKVKGDSSKPLTVSREYCGRNVFSMEDEHQVHHRRDSRYQRSPSSRSSSSDSSSSSSSYGKNRRRGWKSDHRSRDRRRSRTPVRRRSRTPDRRRSRSPDHRRSRTPENASSKAKGQGQGHSSKISPGARQNIGQQKDLNVSDSKKKPNAEDDKVLSQMEQFLNQLKEKKKEQSSKVKPW